MKTAQTEAAWPETPKRVGIAADYALAWELTQTFLASEFNGTERLRRRLAKARELETNFERGRF
jgi:hypothetical protein